MQTNTLPTMNMDTSETGCCPKFVSEGWDGTQIEFQDKRFARAETRSFMHFPLNIGGVFKRVNEKIVAENASMKDSYFVLSHDLSPWKGEHYFAVEKDIPGEEMVNMSGSFLTKVFEGPFQNVGKWSEEMKRYVESNGKKVKKRYFFYTTCPKCAKTFGKNFVVAFAQV